MMSRAVNLLARNRGARRFFSNVANSLKAQSEGARPVTREEMGAELKAIRSEMAGEFSTVRSEMAGEFKAVRSEMKAFEAKVDSEFKAVRSEMAGEFKAVRSEMASQFQILGEKIDGQNDYMNKMVAGAGTAFLATIGMFGVYTLNNSRAIGKLEGRLESLGQNGKPGGGVARTPTPTPSLSARR